MIWKKQLLALEQHKEWDFAIEYMQSVITEHANDVDAYLSMCYLLMNLLVEEEYDESKHDYYTDLCKKYFQESYARFHEDAEYLFFIAEIAYMSEWYFDITVEDADKMRYKAMNLDPNNSVYTWYNYMHLNKNDPNDFKKLKNYVLMILSEDSPIKSVLNPKGSLGKCFFDMMSHWARRILRELDEKK